MYVDHPNHEERLRAADGITLQPGHDDDDDDDNNNDYSDNEDDDGDDDGGFDDNGGGGGGFDGGDDDDTDDAHHNDDNEVDNHRFLFISLHLYFYSVEVLTRWSFSSTVQIIDGDLGRGAAVFGRDPVMLEVFAKGMLLWSRLIDRSMDR
jgi:hypothetical protein